MQGEIQVQTFPVSEDIAESYAFYGNEKWHPSADISAAWQVVEKLISEGYDVRIDYDAEQQLWICHLTSEKVEEWSKSKAAPEAICKASLLTKPTERR